MVRPRPGFLLVNKPADVTSFSLVHALQQRLEAIPGKALKVMHGGALDPFADGLMVLLLGPATKLFERLHEVPKTYVATVEWGTETDTLDAGGTVVRTAPPPPEVASLNAALQTFLGWLPQVPPATSNKWVDGERAYTRAHRGETVALPPSQVFLHRAAFANDGVTLTLTCRGGFYVRSLVRDVARAVNSAAHVKTLHRASIGPWRVPALEQEVQLTGADLLPWLETVELSDDAWARFRKNEALPRGLVRKAKFTMPPDFPPVGHRLSCVHQGRLVGTALIENELFRAETVFQNGL